MAFRRFKLAIFEVVEWHGTHPSGLSRMKGTGMKMDINRTEDR